VPQNVLYTAARSVISGHTAGNSYTLDLALREKDRKRRVKKDIAESLDGHVFTTYHHGRVSWSIKSRPLTLTETLAWREWLDSVEDGQLFSFDPDFAAGASPHHYRGVILEGSQYSEQRVESGTSQADHRFVFSVELREVPA
jgi:hypothetical protein